ncbi:MAG TPA: hypothetical protein VF120_08925 [Ktedonobacterales bacterium]
MPENASRDDVSRLIEQTVDRLRADREHGASWLSREAAHLLERLTTSVPARQAQARVVLVRHAAMQLAQVRPSMAAVAIGVARIWSAGSEVVEGDASEQAGTRLERIHTAAQNVLTSWNSSADQITAVARPLLGPTVFTLSRSGTVEAVLSRLARAHEEHSMRRVLVAESRPGGEGVVTARALAKVGLAVTLVPDAAIGAVIGEASVVVLGADSVRANGDVVNKVGSYPLSLVAREAGVPVYVLAETLKIAAPNFPLILEPLEWPEMPQLPGPGIELRSVGFEVVPARLITEVISEAGPLDRIQIAARAQAVGRVLAELLATCAPGG